jgi:DNA-binding protein HU-beta
MASVTKADLVNNIAAHAGINRDAAQAALAATLDAISTSLHGGNKVTLVGFGTFNIADRSARTGRNPRTKAPMNIPAYRTVTFKPGAALKKTVN